MKDGIKTWIILGYTGIYLGDFLGNINTYIYIDMVYFQADHVSFFGNAPYWDIF